MVSIAQITADIAELVPETHARYRGVILAALECFVGGLSAPRQQAILADQASMPAGTSAARRVVALLQHSPLLHKLGQLLARHRSLDFSLRRQLQTLESLLPTTSQSDWLPPILAALQASAIPVESIHVADQALAEASVAVVVPFEWNAGGAIRHGVFKVKRPNIERHLAEELTLLPQIAAVLDERAERDSLPRLDYAAVFDDLRTILQNEVYFDRERDHLRRAALQYRHISHVHVPELFPIASSDVIAMERIDGRRVTDAVCAVAAPPSLGAGRRGTSTFTAAEAARRVVNAMLADVIFTRSGDVLFHADPHAGNLLATADGTLAPIDWSMAGTLTTQRRTDLTRLIVATVMQDANRVRHAIRQIAIHVPQSAPMHEPISDALAELRRGALPGPIWVTGLLDRMIECGVTFDSDALLFRKTLLTLAGVVADLDPTVDIDVIMTATAMTRFAAEIPLRMVSPPWSCHFSVPLSNAELLEVAAGGSAAFWRFWSGGWSTWLNRRQSVPQN